MANEEHIEKLREGVGAWNAWRKEHPEIKINLNGALLSGIDFKQADLREAELIMACLKGAHLRGADLSKAVLIGAQLHEANLRDADLREADLSDAVLCKATLIQAGFGDANLKRANLCGADLRYANFREATLQKANLKRANLWRANLCQANLIDANLNGGTLTEACLWETQRAGWSIQGILCESVYWDRDRQERTTYIPGEFERLYADKTKVVLQYAGGIISSIEVTTLPSMIEIMQKWSGCVLRLDSLQDAPGGATVTLVIENPGKRNADQTATLQAELQSVGQRAIEIQRELIQEREGRLRAEGALNFVSNFFSPLMERVMAQSPGTQISISGGTIHGNIVGEVSGDNAQVNYTHNDLAALEVLVGEMSAHCAELLLTSSERTQFEENLNTIKEQLATQSPNHSLLREALHTVRHILEAGVAHVLVGQWLPLLHNMR